MMMIIKTNKQKTKEKNQLEKNKVYVEPQQ